MPTYEFLCGNCGKLFEIVCSVKEYERQEQKGIRCLKCGSPKISRQISGFEVKTSKKT